MLLSQSISISVDVLQFSFYVEKAPLNVGWLGSMMHHSNPSISKLQIL